MKKRILIISVLVFSSTSSLMADSSQQLNGAKPSSLSVGESSTGGDPAGRQCKYQKLIDEAQAPLSSDHQSSNNGSAL